MVFPLVFAWMEQANHRFTFGIAAAHVRGFIEIAVKARPREVIEGACAAVLHRNNMVGPVREKRIVFRRQAILAAAASPFS